MENGSQLRDVLSNRHDVLESLRDEPKSKPELVADLEHSRSTIDRAITELRTVDCIEPDGDGRSRYRPTQTGALALRSYRQFCREADALTRRSRVVNALPPTADVSTTFVATADLYASAKTPDVALQPAVELLPGATRLIGTAPVVFGDYFDVLGEWIRGGDAEMELVLEAELLESIATTYADEFDALTDPGSVDVYVSDERIPYALWVIEGEQTAHAGITIYEGGGIKGTLVSDADPAVRWARHRYERFRAQSQRLELDAIE